MRQIRWWFGVMVVFLLFPSRTSTAETVWRCVQPNGQMPLTVYAEPDFSSALLTTLSAADTLEADYSRLYAALDYNWVPVRATSTEGWTITARLSPCSSEYTSPTHDVVLKDVNQDGTLDHLEVEAVARAVVMLFNFQGENAVSAGSGTIISPDGLILTNAHVVEEADFMVVALLTDINDRPEPLYIADVASLDAEFDVALVAIRYDLEGNPIDAGSLNLPYLPATLPAADVFRGDPVYIFGYPGIGNDYLVMTTGTIVTVENGTVNEDRLPIWYRTDAEIAPGNSGGLAVNGNGEFVGVPTLVSSETETGGRLGVIRPVQVALTAALFDQTTMAALPPTPPPDQVTVELEAVQTEHGVIVDDIPGLQIHLSFAIFGWQDQSATVTVRFYQDDIALTPLINSKAPGQYRDKNDIVVTAVPIAPCCAETVYDDLQLFLPYTALGLPPGEYRLKYEVVISNDEFAWERSLTWQHLLYTRRAP
ncbi:MAG TPA: serine protease [Aggregatilineaceae bacterium]|nr:serine protease [Aggregatilineaceae bacterium]